MTQTVKMNELFSPDGLASQVLYISSKSWVTIEDFYGESYVKVHYKVTTVSDFDCDMHTTMTKKMSR